MISDFVPHLVRATCTIDTRPGHDLRKDEEAVVLCVEEEGKQSHWKLLVMTDERVVNVSFWADRARVLKRWLQPV